MKGGRKGKRGSTEGGGKDRNWRETSKDNEKREKKK